MPSVAGLEGAAAFALLERNGFTPSRHYAPSTEIEAWHAVDTDPRAGTKLKRPVRVALVVSTGPPKRPVPALDGLDSEEAARTLRDAGFSPVVEERPTPASSRARSSAVTPSPGTRTPVGSTVTIVVARAPHWEAVSRVEGTEDAEAQPFDVPAGARLVLSTVRTRPRSASGAAPSRCELSGDTEGSTEIDAGQAIVLADAVRRRPDDLRRGRRPRLGTLDARRRGARASRGDDARCPRSRERRPRGAP